jgi:hypothetical protein
LLAGLLLILVATAAQASDRSMRCGTHLIYAGGGSGSSTVYEVLKKCGDPVAKNGDTWIYEQGRVVRTLTFFQGRLQRIESSK